MDFSQTPRQYLNPYLAGVLLGLVLLASFLIAGNGLGVSGAVSQTLVHLYHWFGIDNDYLREQQSSEHWWQSWIVVEVSGVFIGALLSARLSGRHRRETIKGAHCSDRRRLLLCFGGGALMGFAARLARGCTSGQALSGGALLSVGSWAFMLAVFVGGYLAIQWTKRSWQ